MSAVRISPSEFRQCRNATGVSKNFEILLAIRQLCRISNIVEILIDLRLGMHRTQEQSGNPGFGHSRHRKFLVQPFSLFAHHNQYYL
jgi:hypothetical protein